MPEVYDAEVVGDLVAEASPVSRDLLTKKSRTATLNSAKLT
jgi:hypothetical protein